MKLILTILLGCFTFLGLSQSHSKNTLSINAGFDGGVHGTLSKTYYSGILIDEDTSAAGTTLFRFDAHYNFLKWLSAGFFFRTGKYIEDPKNAEADGNKVVDYALGLRFYPVNKDKFALYLGLYFGGTNLNINRLYSTVPTSYKWNGSNFSADLGFNWYFVKSVGLNFSLGYSAHKFNLNELSVRNTPQDLTNWEHNFNTKGVHVCLGIAIHLFGS